MSPVADQERTERLAEQHRREIVDAAERLVKGNGLHQLKLRDIAKESGKSLGNLYNYFQNKEAQKASLPYGCFSKDRAVARGGR